MDEIADDIHACTLCPLSEGRNQAVPGTGSANPRAVIIGEAPGKDEDRIGVPFVGRAGKLLDSVLDNAGLDRSELFITNIVKCRPPKNRVPKSKEIIICKETYLDRQIELIKPKIIVLLGRTATRAMLGAGSLGEVRGRKVRKGSIDYLATFHPAAILRNPRLRPELASDLAKLRTEV